MYADPRHIRNNRVNLSLSDAERRALEAVADLNGTQPAVFLRDLMIDFLRSHAQESAPVAEPLRVTH